jgi:hypothetical protein
VIEQGLVMLINAGLGPQFIGGFANQLPQSAVLPNYTYLTVSERSVTGLQVPGGLSLRRWEVNCFGVDANSAIGLANDIMAILIGYQGTLPNSVQVDSIFQSDVIDFEQDATARNYRRMVEFDVNYYPTIFSSRSWPRFPNVTQAIKE